MEEALIIILAADALMLVIALILLAELDLAAEVEAGDAECLSAPALVHLEGF